MDRREIARTYGLCDFSVSSVRRLKNVECDRRTKSEETKLKKYFKVAQTLRDHDIIFPDVFDTYFNMQSEKILVHHRQTSTDADKCHNVVKMESLKICTLSLSIRQLLLLPTLSCEYFLSKVLFFMTF